MLGSKSTICFDCFHSETDAAKVDLYTPIALQIGVPTVTET